jgi:hypothetical protein
MCARVDNEWSSVVVITRCRSFGALDHQHHDLHSIDLSLGPCEAILVSLSLFLLLLCNPFPCVWAALETFLWSQMLIFSLNYYKFSYILCTKC